MMNFLKRSFTTEYRGTQMIHWLSLPKAGTRIRDREEFKETTKTKLKRVIPMNSLVRAYLLKCVKTRSTLNNFVFTKADGFEVEVHHVYRDFMKAQTKSRMENKLR